MKNHPTKGASADSRHEAMTAAEEMHWCLPARIYPQNPHDGIPPTAISRRPIWSGREGQKPKRIHLMPRLQLSNKTGTAPRLTRNVPVSSAS